MIPPTFPKDAGLELHAWTKHGLVPLSVESASGTVHDLLEQLPVGVYSALRTFHHDRFLWLEAHFDRTERSMAQLGWNKPLDRDALRNGLDAAVRAYPLPDARVRFDVLREPVTIQGHSADMFLALSPYVAVSEEFLRDGVRVELATHLCRPTPRVKTTDFVRTRKPLPLGTRDRYEGVLLDEQRRCLECSSANLGFVRGDEILSAGDGVLEGITSLVLQKVAPTLGLRWTATRVPIAEVGAMDEAFLSSSSRGVVPIVEIEGARIGTGRVGDKVPALLAAYLAFAERNAQRAPKAA